MRDRMVYGDVVDLEVDKTFKINVMRTDQGYVIDLFTVQDELFIDTMTVWDDDIETVILESQSICDTAEMEEEG